MLTLPLFFASNALYPLEGFPSLVRTLSLFNPLTHLVNGIRYFAIGSDFQSIGVHYIYPLQEIATSFGALLGFAVVMYAVAWWVFKKAVVT